MERRMAPLIRGYKAEGGQLWEGENGEYVSSQGCRRPRQSRRRIVIDNPLHGIAHVQSRAWDNIGHLSRRGGRRGRR